VSGAISTVIEGDAGTIQSTVDWLRDTVGPAVGDASSTMASAITGTVTEWVGAAGDAFRSEVTVHRGLADQLSDGVDTASDAFDHFAEALRAAQRKLTEIRETAAAEALDLTVDHILPPRLVAIPGKLTEGATAAQRAAHQAAVDLFAEYQRKVKAFRAAAEDVAKVVKDHAAAARELVSNLALLDDLRDWAKLDEVARLADTKAYKLLRLGLKRFALADVLLTAGENAWDIWHGEAPGEVQVGAAAETVAFYLELLSNNPRGAAFFEAIGLGDYDWDNLDDDAVDLYLKLPPGLREHIDLPGLIAAGEYARAEDIIRDDVESMQDTVADGVEVLGNVSDAGIDVVTDKGTDLAEEGKDLADKGKDLVEEFAPEILVPSWP